MCPRVVLDHLPRRRLPTRGHQCRLVQRLSWWTPLRRGLYHVLSARGLTTGFRDVESLLPSTQLIRHHLSQRREDYFLFALSCTCTGDGSGRTKSFCDRLRLQTCDDVDSPRHISQKPSLWGRTERSRKMLAPRSPNRAMSICRASIAESMSGTHEVFQMLSGH